MPLARLRLLAARRVSAGPGVTLGRRVRLDVSPGARLLLAPGAVLGDGTRVHAHAGDVRVGEGAVLGDGCTITAHAGVSIGARARLGDHVAIVDFDHGIDDVERPVRLQALTAAAVTIGDGAVIGQAASVLRGVTVGAGARVDPHAVVRRDVPAGARVGGVPAAISPG